MKLIPVSLIDDLISKAGTSERRRANHNVHEAPSDPVQRLFVAAKLDSYFRPHRHPAKWEFAVVLRGCFDIILLDDHGKVTNRIAVGPGTDTIGFELPAGTWHTWVPILEDSVFLEVKQGPYDACTVAEFAGWSPAEGVPEVSRFVEQLKKSQIGDCVVQTSA